MKKNNKRTTLNTHKKHVKNVKRKARAEALYSFNDMTAKVKAMQEALKNSGNIV
jgi:hypothetical protein